MDNDMSRAIRLDRFFIAFLCGIVVVFFTCRMNWNGFALFGVMTLVLFYLKLSHSPKIERFRKLMTPEILENEKFVYIIAFFVALTMAYFERELLRDEINRALAHETNQLDMRFEVASRLLLSATVQAGEFLFSLFSNRMDRSALFVFTSFIWCYGTILSFLSLAKLLFQTWTRALVCLLGLLFFFPLAHQHPFIAQIHILGLILFALILVFEQRWIALFVYAMIASLQRPDAILVTSFTGFFLHWFDKKKISVPLFAMGTGLAAISFIEPKIIMWLKNSNNFSSFPILQGNFEKLNGNINYLPYFLMWSSLPLVLVFLRPRFNAYDKSLAMTFLPQLLLVTLLADYSEPRLLMPWFAFLILIGMPTLFRKT